MTCPVHGPVRPLPNPRKAGLCPRCGRVADVLTPKVTEIRHMGPSPYAPTADDPEPADLPVTSDVQRDHLLEVRFTREAARLAGVDPAALMAFAEQRTHPGPLRNAAARDWVVEIREELADARNYACWEAQRVLALGDATGLRHLARSLALLIEAWHELGLYEQERQH